MIMAFYLSPMVDVKETDLSLTIPSVATSIGVIILRDTYKGPELKQSFVSSEDDLISMFGEPTAVSECYIDMLSASGFLKYGRNLYATRVLSEDATFAGIKVALDGQGSAFASSYTLDDLPSNDPDEFASDIVVDDANPLWMIATSRGAWGNKVRVSILDKLSQTQMLSGGNDAWTTYPLFKSIDEPLEDVYSFLIVVEEMNQGGTEWFKKEVFNVSTKERSIDDQGATRFVENVINQSSKLIRVKMNDDNIDQPFSVHTSSPVVLLGGSNGTVGITDADIMDALDLYKNSEAIDVNMIIDSDKSETVKKYMDEICQIRKDCMAILDCKKEHVVANRGNEVTDLTDWRKGLGLFTTNNLNINSSYSAVYGNWIEVYDRYNKKYRWIPASGHVGGIYANTDQTNDAWWAPAGLNRAILTSVRRLAWNPDLGKRDILYMNGINPVVSFAGQGKVVWGQKTLLDKSSAFNRVNVRRLFIVLEKAISTASKYFLFEPNDIATRESIIAMINPFLRDVKGRRGIYDYRVVCDETNNSSERIDRNEMWVSLYIKPTRTAEFIVLNFIAMKTGASFTEAAAIIGEV
jgi:hypothetical protein